MHNERGSQYVSEQYRNAITKMQCRYSKKAFLWDNACVESFHSKIKGEWLNRFNIQNYRNALSYNTNTRYRVQIRLLIIHSSISLVMNKPDSVSFILFSSICIIPTFSNLRNKSCISLSSFS